MQRLREAKMNLKSSFLLFIVLALTSLELIFLREEITLPILLMISLTALLAIIAMDISRILQILQNQKGDK